jgi:hypothetical protein
MGCHDWIASGSAQLLKNRDGWTRREGHFCTGKRLRKPEKSETLPIAPTWRGIRIHDSLESRRWMVECQKSGCAEFQPASKIAWFAIGRIELGK